MYCSICGKKIDDDAEFCPYCGTSVLSKYQQKSNEMGFEYAGFWKRFAAYLIDSLILLGILIAFYAVAYADNNEDLFWFFYFIWLIGHIFYFGIQESSAFQATLGKRFLKLKVIDNNGNRITFWRALGRYMAKIISSLILYIGFIMIGFTERKQGLHDLMADTLVIIDE